MLVVDRDVFVLCTSIICVLQPQMPDNAFRGPPGPMGGPMGGPPQMAPNPYGPPK